MSGDLEPRTKHDDQDPKITLQNWILVLSILAISLAILADC